MRPYFVYIGTENKSKRLALQIIDETITEKFKKTLKVVPMKNASCSCVEADSIQDAANQYKDLEGLSEKVKFNAFYNSEIYEGGKL